MDSNEKEQDKFEEEMEVDEISEDIPSNFTSSNKKHTTPSAETCSSQATFELIKPLSEVALKTDYDLTSRRQTRSMTSSNGRGSTPNTSSRPSHSLGILPRHSLRAESVLRSTLKKMRGRNRKMPGGASAKSLTELICNEYGWPAAPVKDRVERALKRALKEGKIQMVNSKGKERKYIIAHRKMQECLANHEKSIKKNRIMKTFSQELGPSLNSSRKRNRSQEN